jgi:hypothetical protein
VSFGEIHMSKFMILFHGGNIPKDKAEQSVSDRLAWMNNLRNSGKFIEGSPLDIEGKVITDQTKISTYIYNEAEIRQLKPLINEQ